MTGLVICDRFVGLLIVLRVFAPQVASFPSFSGFQRNSHFSGHPLLFTGPVCDGFVVEISFKNVFIARCLTQYETQLCFCVFFLSVRPKHGCHGSPAATPSPPGREQAGHQFTGALLTGQNLCWRDKATKDFRTNFPSIFLWFYSDVQHIDWKLRYLFNCNLHLKFLLNRVKTPPPCTRLARLTSAGGAAHLRWTAAGLSPAPTAGSGQLWLEAEQGSEGQQLREEEAFVRLSRSPPGRAAQMVRLYLFEHDRVGSGPQEVDDLNRGGQPTDTVIGHRCTARLDRLIILNHNYIYVILFKKNLNLST